MHGKRKSQCRDCGESSFCIHDKYKTKCRECNLNGFVTQLYRKRLHIAFKNKHGLKLLPTIQALCIDEVIIHLEDLFEDGDYSWETYGKNDTGKSWQIDHIVPINAKIGGVKPTHEQKLARCHYANTRPLWVDLHKARPANGEDIDPDDMEMYFRNLNL
tara:strand:- start:35 stop:511 length:477 start_codon:yes stop_codon:yes gene_type:complete